MNSNSFTWLSDRSPASPCMARAACGHNVDDKHSAYQQPSRHAAYAASAPDASIQPACAANDGGPRGGEAGFTWISEVIDSIHDDRQLHQERSPAPVPFKTSTASQQPHRGSVMHRQPNKQHTVPHLNTSPAPAQPCSPAQRHTSHLPTASTSNHKQNPGNGNAKKPWYARRRANKPAMYPMQQTHHRHTARTSSIHPQSSASHNMSPTQQQGTYSLPAYPTVTTTAGCSQLLHQQCDLAQPSVTKLSPVNVSAVKSASGPTGRAAATAAAAAAAAASLASNVFACMGAAASAVLDRLLGVDPTLEVVTTAAAAAEAAANAGGEVPCLRCLDQAVAPQQQQQPIFSRLPASNMQAAAQQKQPSPLQQASQQGLQTAPLQQQQQSRQPSTESLGAGMAATLAMFPYLGAAATAVEAAYTESIRPGAELIWLISHAVLLYLVLPMLQVLLTALQMAMRSGGCLLRAAVWVSRRCTLQHTST